MPVTDVEIRQVERWFMARGTPHLMADYSATEDVFTRMLPVFTLVVLLEVGGALRADAAWWQNVLAAVGGLAVLIGIWAAVNRARGRPALTRPGRVGAPEVATFVVVPALVTAVFGGQWAQGLGIAAVNLLVLGATYLVASYGLLPLTRWALGKTVRELGAVAGLLGRALPLLLLIQIVLFINTEMWQVAGDLAQWRLAATIGLFFLIGLTFLLTRLPKELGRIAAVGGADELRELVAGTPAEAMADLCTDADCTPAPLSRRQRGNVLLVALFSQGLQVVLVALLLGSFFVLFGLLAVSDEVIRSWLGHRPEEVATLSLFGDQLHVTEELLKISAFLAAFSGLYFTVVLVTDSTYREEFLDEILAELRQTLAVRTAYLRALRDRAT